MSREISNDERFRLYFEDLGYEISWDRHGKQCWYELYKGNKLIVQIDMNVELDHIIEDICCLHQKKDTTSSSDYIISGKPSEELEILYEEVYDKEQFVKEK